MQIARQRSRIGKIEDIGSIVGSESSGNGIAGNESSGNSIAGNSNAGVKDIAVYEKTLTRRRGS